MKAHATWKKQSCRMRLEGAMDIYCVAALKSELLEAFARSKQIELDLSGVCEIDSSGFQLLALLKREGARTQRPVSFCNHSEPVIRLLDVYGATGLFGDPVVLSSAAS